MQVPVISVGNSKGIRLSKLLLEKYKIHDKVELVMEADYIIIKPVALPREGWDEAFQSMHEAGDDSLFIPDIFEDEFLED